MDSTVLGEILSVLLFAVAIGTLMLGYPVAFTLGGTSLLFALLGWLVGAFDPSYFATLAPRYFGIMQSEVLVAVPLFILMGTVLERTRIAEALLTTMGQCFGPLRGGLAVAVIVVGALLAASTGVVGATVVTMGLISLPAMLRAGYDPRLATGAICASGTLGQIIPPSTILIFVADFLQGANAEAQLRKGNFAPDPVSVSDLFAGALLPGLLLVGLYILWSVALAWARPSAAPAITMTDAERGSLPLRIVASLVPPLLLILAVLGSILAGIATPTESASVGAVGAAALAILRGELSLARLQEAAESTLKTTSMVFIILFGASMFSLVFRTMGGELLIEQVLHGLPGGRVGAVLAAMGMMFLLGFFLDTFEIIFIVVPLTAPALLLLDIDPIWLGVMIGVNLQTSFLTPPFGFALFYLRGVAPGSVSTGDLYRGIIPFVALQLLALGLLWEFPGLATWLPRLLFG
ncbi:TRAP transporter large permease subunit [Elioraea sp. Yellowstone]|jgi:tripartite ATP-independent transporter DctM subunit|uniref:TRAP transporter large permease n=1 Tax=Elioraea sp. Yellowstone TaxID=2592070 RepID=UPI00114F425C|nr:TRAP transporter large permease subunit [Elioraea sp. Yellowstone]TQF78076.1 TRAP transporter large permease subunit [Elioraea sp. Yellowstone]